MRLHALVLAGLSMLGGPAVADSDGIVANWPAPPYWTAPVAKEARSALVAASPLPFIALPPCRIIDTRGNAPMTGGFLPSATVRSYTVTGVCGIPANAAALSLNATVVHPTGPGFLTLYPEGGTYPTVSTLNFLGNDVIVNAAVVPLSASGGISMALGVSGGDVILDTNGYYAPLTFVRSLSGVSGDVALAAGSNVTITPAGNTLTIASTGGGGAPSGPAGGSLAGTYPNPGFASGAVGTAQLAAGAVTDAKVASGIAYSKLAGAPAALPPTGAAGGGLSGSYPNPTVISTPAAAPNSIVSRDASGSFGVGSLTFVSALNFIDTRLLHLPGLTNLFLGLEAGSLSVTGGYNTSVGHHVLGAISSGSDNTGIGSYSLTSDTKGNANTALGSVALAFNTTSSGNTAVGYGALESQTFSNSGAEWNGLNTAVGVFALLYNDSTNGFNATENTAIGADALLTNTTGFQNTALGSSAGYRIGSGAGYSGPITYVANTTGNYNTFIGRGTGTTANNLFNCTAIGIDAYCDGNDQVRLGNTYVGSIGGKVGWSALSDARAKRDIRDLDLGLDFVLRLRPVEYTLKIGNGRRDLGFLAQDVEAVLGSDYNVVTVGGDPARTLSLRYTDLIAPLVKAIQEQQAMLDARNARIDELERRLTALEESRSPSAP